jgi:hypothetical protein
MTIGIFYKLLNGYIEDINKVKEIPKEKNRCGYFPFSPVTVRCSLIWIIKYLEKNKVDVSRLKNDFFKEDIVLTEYKSGHTDTYYRNVYCDYKKMVDKYDPDAVLLDGYEFEYVICRRTDIENMAQELEGIYDIEKEKDEVIKKDELLKEKIVEAVKVKTYSPMDLLYAPKEYWWLYLEDTYGKPEEIID